MDKIQNLIFQLKDVLLVVFGFLLAVLWDYLKYVRDNKRKEYLVLSAVNEELISNIFVCQSNKNAIEQELESLKNQKCLVSPLMRLEDSAWDLIKINLPESILKDIELLKKLRSLSQLIKNTNESIFSRENYRIYNGAMDNYNNRLQIYDSIILERTNDLTSRIEILVKEFGPLIGKSYDENPSID